MIKTNIERTRGTKYLNNSPQFVIVPTLHVTGQRKVLPQRVSLEPVVCEDPPEVWVVGEVDPVHVPDFSLVPVSGFEDVID